MVNEHQGAWVSGFQLFWNRSLPSTWIMPLRESTGERYASTRFVPPVRKVNVREQTFQGSKVVLIVHIGISESKSEAFVRKGPKIRASNRTDNEVNM